MKKRQPVALIELALPAEIRAAIAGEAQKKRAVYRYKRTNKGRAPSLRSVADAWCVSALQSLLPDPLGAISDLILVSPDFEAFYSYLADPPSVEGRPRSAAGEVDGLLLARDSQAAQAAQDLADRLRCNLHHALRVLLGYWFFIFKNKGL